MLDNVIGFSDMKTMFEAVDIRSIRACVVLYGVQHIGKYTLARAMADSLTTTPENVHVLSLQDGKSQITIEQVRTMLDEIKLLPYNGDKYRVVIIDDAQCLNAVSENAILKLLEEPPEYVKLFLITPDYSMLLPTIKSRCMAYRLYHTEADVKEVYDSLSLEPDLEDFAKRTIGTQVGILLGLKDQENVSKLKTQKSIVESLLSCKSRADTLKYQEQFNKCGLSQTLQMALTYHMASLITGKTADNARQWDALKAVYEALQDSIRGLSQILIVDRLISGIVTANK